MSELLSKVAELRCPGFCNVDAKQALRELGANIWSSRFKELMLNWREEEAGEIVVEVYHLNKRVPTAPIFEMLGVGRSRMSPIQFMMLLAMQKNLTTEPSMIANGPNIARIDLVGTDWIISAGFNPAPRKFTMDIVLVDNEDPQWVEGTHVFTLLTRF